MDHNRVALYARVSTTQGQQDPQMQLRELREYAAHRGWKIADEYVDRCSGSRESRPRLNQLMADAQQRKFDVILVWKLDRFGRSLRHLVNALEDLKALNVSFVSLKDQVDLTTPTGKLMFHVIAAMAEFERTLIVERVKGGLQNARAKGKRLGRPRLVVSRAKVERLHREGKSLRAIAKQMGVSKTSVMRMLALR